MAATFAVLAVYAALALWAGTLVPALRSGVKGSGPFFALSLLLTLVLNARYPLEGAQAGIAFFVGIYDVAVGLGLDREKPLPASMSTCANNTCTVLGEDYSAHSGWAVAFYDRFDETAPATRKGALQAHIAFNTAAFVLLHAQLLWPGGQSRWHRPLGRLCFCCLTLGCAFACLLAAEHGAVPAYGGRSAMYGFWFLALCAWLPAALGVVAITRGDRAGHRRWMLRCAGGMYGAFWLFRALLLVIDPLLREYRTAAIEATIWLSGPLGLAVGEAVARRLEGAAKAE